MERDELQYIVDATNHVHRIVIETVKPTADDFRKVFSVTCNTLKRVVAQVEVMHDLKELAVRQQEFWDDFEDITGNVEHFVHGFCYIERQVLINAGITVPAAESLVLEAINLRENIKILKIKPNDVRQNLKTLRDQSCAIAMDLSELPQTQLDQQREKKKLKKFFYGLAGVVIVGTNGSSLAVSLGMSLAGTAVSLGFGGALIGAALAID